MRRLTSLVAPLLVVAALAGCRGGDDDTAASSVPETAAVAEATTAAPVASDPVPTDPPTTQPPTTEPPTTQPPTTEPPVTEPPTTEPNVVVPVDLDGSVQDVLAGREDLSNMSAAVDAWLLDDPGREGVLRNPRGITLFVPNNDGFTVQDVAAAGADFDAFTLFLTAHLKVVATPSAEFGDSILTADGSTYPLSPLAVGFANIVEADVEATNGVIHVIDAPLATITPL